MSSVRRLTVGVIVLGVIAGAPMVAATPALAAEQWGVLGSFGLASGDPQPLSGPAGLAVNQGTGHASSGDVYVADRGNSRVERFSSTGAYLGQFNGSGTYEVEGKKETGAAAATGALLSPEDIAIDSDPGSPSFGDVYVIDEGHNVIDKFSATGAYIGQLTGTCEQGNESPPRCPKSHYIPFAALDGVAVDPGGVVWVENGAIQPVAIDSFTSEQPNVFRGSRSAETGAAVQRGLAVDSEDDLYIIFQEGRCATKLNSSAELVGEPEIGGECGRTGLAVDPANNDLYLDGGSSVSVWSPAESLLESESFGSGLLNGAGSVAVDPAAGGSGYAYVAEPRDNNVLFFEHSETPQSPPPAPTTEEAKAIMGTAATLHGELNPEEVKGGVGYHFSYSAGTGSTCTGPDSMSTSFDGGASNVTGSKAVEVSATVALQPHEEYVFCLVADKYGSTPGDEVPLTTPGEKPDVISESVANLFNMEGEFTAVINPEREETTYVFEYATTEAAIGTPSAKKASGEEPLPAEFGEPTAHKGASIHRNSCDLLLPGGREKRDRRNNGQYPVIHKTTGFERRECLRGDADGRDTASRSLPGLPANQIRV